MNQPFKLAVPALLFCLSCFTAQASFVELGSAGAYTVLTTAMDTSASTDVGIGSADTTITGDVAFGPNSSGTAEKATINGNLFVDKSSTVSIHPDLIVNGSTFMNQSLNGAVKDAFKASNYFSSLSATQTFGNITGSTTFSGTNGLNVITLGSVNEQGTITISGSASSKFVFNIGNGFTLNGGSMVLTGGVTADNVLFNLNGSGPGVDIYKPVGNAVGIFLAPQQEIILDKATLLGAVIGGGDGNKLVIHSGATLVGVVPEVTPGSVIFGFLGLIVAISSRRALMARVRLAAASRNAVR